MKGPFRLLVLYGLVTLGSSQVDVDQFVTVNRGQEVTLRCVYTGTLIPASIIWQKVNGDSSVRIAIALSSGYRIDNSTFYGRLNFTNYTSELRNGSIRIEDIRLGDEGDFTCMFATLDVDVQATINLTVNVPPKVFPEFNPYELVDGMGLVTVATCVAQEGKPAASITWSGLHEGSFNETTETEPDGTVTVRSRYWLEPTYESHGRTLTCRVEHPALESPVEYSTTLNIHFPPNVSLELNHSQLVEGMGLVTVATCVAQEGQPAAFITWSGLQQGSYNETTESEPDGKVTVRSSYWLEPTHESHGRTLTCRVEHPALESPVEYSTTLNIHFPPKLFLELNPSQLVEGMGLVTVATCIARQGQPAASITWSGLHQGSSNETSEAEPEGTVTVRSRYWMEPTHESHGRTLICRVEHPAWVPARVELSTTLDIHYEPRVSIAGYDGDWHVGKEVASLTCEVDANPSITRYLWGRQDGSLPNGTVISGNSLSFERPLAESDSGSFSCWANNSVGWGEAVVIITIRPGGDGGVEPWVIAVATVVPLMALVAVVGAVYYFCFHKNGKPLKRKGEDENDQQRAPVETPQHKELPYEYIDSKLPSRSVALERPPLGGVTAMPEYDTVPEELSSWNRMQHLDERIVSSTETNPPNQTASSHYELLKPRAESVYDKLNHPTYMNA
ncbi:nectin-2-like [Lethenteron reissneri]|uniref:nectin-2-like n=1 Tax=Lethenteron reissneri TaxID=7753 RepID=UPI002AB6573A|nr:nectin-2-like [Lethenteron reissneri]